MLISGIQLKSTIKVGEAWGKTTPNEKVLHKQEIFAMERNHRHPGQVSCNVSPGGRTLAKKNNWN